MLFWMASVITGFQTVDNRLIFRQQEGLLKAIFFH